MNTNDIWNIVIAVVSVVIGLLTLFTEKEDQIVIISFGFVTLTIYFINRLYVKIARMQQDIEKNTQNSYRLEEKLQIHEQLIDIKSDIKDLQRRGVKK